MQFFRNLSIAQKLYGTVLISIFVTAAVALFGLYQLSRVEQAAAQVRENWLPSVNYIGILSDQVASYRLLEFKHILSPDERVMQQTETQLESLKLQVRQTFTQLATSQSEGLETQLNGQFEGLFAQYQGLSQPILALSAAGQDSLAFAKITESQVIYNQLNEVLVRLREFNRSGGLAAAGYSSEVYQSAIRSVLALMLMTLVVTGLLTRTMIRSILRPVASLNQSLQALSEGDVSVQPAVASQDEVGQLAAATRKVIAALERSAVFAKQIGEGRFDDSFRPSTAKDVLGAALVGMRDKLQQTAGEDQKRTWATTGYAQLHDLLGGDHLEPQQRYDAVVAFMVKYLKAAQSGLFLLQGAAEGPGHLELVSCYAYDRKKFIERRIEVGVGLVGQVVLERESIFMTKLPAHYLQITSGLGSTAPGCLLVVPLLNNGTVQGVLEMASLEVLLPHQIAFVEKAGESLAAALASLNGAMHTRRLLETAQQQTEQLRAQEEEMRQNMEEIAATQEEMHRKEREYLHRIEELEARLLQSENAG